MAEFGNLDMYGSLNVKENLFVRNNIIQDDILYPKITVTGNTSSRIITVQLSKKDDVLTTSVRQTNFKTATMSTNLMPARPAIHWWFADTNYGTPAILNTGSGPPTVAVTLGLNLEPTNSPNTAIVRTSLSDSNHTYKLTVNAEGGSDVYTGYFMCSVQGIVYSTSFTYASEL